jgi:hypothetical protein
VPTRRTYGERRADCTITDDADDPSFAAIRAGST